MSLTPNLALDLDSEGLSPIEIGLTYQGKKYLLKEASEGATCEYQDEMLRITKPDMETGKPTSVEGMNKLDAGLVSRCLFEVNSSVEGMSTLVPVTLEQVLSWPHRAVERIRNKIREISEIRVDETSIDKQIKVLQDQKAALKQAEGAAKNGRSATAATSA